MSSPSLPTPPSEACDQDKPQNIPTIPLRLASGNGPVTRHILPAPPRDATPSEIPIIDISGIFSTHITDRQSVARQIHDAATNTGFFYISGHGIPSDVTDNAYAACLDFFRQPVGEKMRAHVDKSAWFNGYKPPRSQRINPFEGVDARETFSWTYDPRLDPAHDGRRLEEIPEEIRSFLRIEPDGAGDTSRFPWNETTSVPHFRPAVVAYWRSCLALARALVRSFALSLGLEEDFFDAKFSHPDAALALNYYPPIVARGGSSPSPPANGEEKQQQPEQVSIGSHTDFQLFTILWQDARGGLQVLNRGGQWIRASPVRDTFVVNIGDYMQRITNDRYRSTVHRARNTSGRERVSMPFFFGFNLNESCGVLESCVGEGEEARYEEVGCAEWVRRRVRMMHDTGEGEGESTGCEKEEAIL